MSDQNVTLLLQIVSIICSALTTIAIAVVGMWLKVTNMAAVQERSEIKTSLQSTNSNVSERLEVIHGLVNSGLGVVLDDAARTAEEGAQAAAKLALVQPSEEHKQLLTRARQKAEIARRAS